MIRLNLRTKITAAVSALIVVLMAAVAYITHPYFVKQLKPVISDSQFLMLTATASELDSKLLGMHQQLIVNAKAVPPEALKDVKKARKFLDSRTGLLNLFDKHIYLLTPSGKLIAESSFLPNRHGIDVSFNPCLQKTIENRQPVISEPSDSSPEGKHLVVIMTSPIFNKKGALAGILAGSLDLMRDNILGKISKTRIGETGYLWMTSANGVMYMHPRPERVFSQMKPGMNKLYDRVSTEGFEGTDETVNSYGILMLTSFKRMRVNNWIIAANYPTAEAYAIIHNIEKYVTVVSIICVLCVFVLVSYLIKQLTGPLAAFTQHVGELSLKLGPDRMIPLHKQDEIGTLSQACNQMVAELDKQSEALRKSEELYRTIAEFTTDFVFWRAPDNRTLYVSGTCREATGYSEEEFYASPVLLDSIVHPDDQEEWRRHLNFSGKPDVAHKPMDIRIVTKSGDVRWVSHVCRPIYDAKMQYLGIRGSHADITGRKHAEEERSKLEAQLKQSQKMEAIGQLAGGIAHDFNNILTVIMGYADVIQKKMQSDSQFRAPIEHIFTSSKRAANLVRGLLAFSRKQFLNSVPVDLNEIVKDMGKLLVRLIGEDIELKIMLYDKSLNILADAGQMGQVIMNLTTNARDAMPQGGRLTMETITVELDDEFMRRHGYGKPGSYAVLMVTDNGMGMDESTRARIFEPFFTTKEVGEGTGLGLAMVYGIVKQHDGFINVYSEAGHGTTFKIYLPLISREAEAPLLSTQRASTSGGTETILLVDDDPAVRGFGRSGLEEAGYTVIEAVDGEDAIQKFIENRETIRLLLLDVVLPKKNGKEVYTAIQQNKADVKVIFTSGYTADIIIKKGIAEEGLNLIMKPFILQDLLSKVRDVLDK